MTSHPSAPLQPGTPADTRTDQRYEHEETARLVALVNDAAALVASRGEAAFNELRAAGSRWRRDETYVFVLDPAGNMLVHADPELEGGNQLDLKDVQGRPVIRGLIDAATSVPGRTEEWYHYEWPVPGGLLPRWKSSFVQRVLAPSGESYIVGAGLYNDRMERAFAVDLVTDAAARIEEMGEAAFPLLRDTAGPFLVKDTYVFVLDLDGVALVHPGFPNLEGRSLRDVRDTAGKLLVREMLEVVRESGSGWVDYMWPKPGESASTQKSTFVRAARLDDRAVIVGCGVYLADAPADTDVSGKMSAGELMSLVRDAAAVLEERGEEAYPELRREGSRWFTGDTYLFVWTLEGKRVFHAADPSGEGMDVSGLEDVLGRPIGRAVLELAASPAGEGWIHYMYPEPGGIFPTWKSTFVKRVTFPSGAQHVVGCGIYNMRMEPAFVVDVVDRAAALVAERGEQAFPTLRDRKGPYFFMDTYVFVDRPDGTELVNPAQPSLEGVNLMSVRDTTGKELVKEYLTAAVGRGSAWVEYRWYRPGSNEPARKRAYVRRVEVGSQTYVVGSGLYAGGEGSVREPGLRDAGE